MRKSVVNGQGGIAHTTPSSARNLTQTRRDMIEAGGRVCQLLGFPRSTGQIYGLLLLSPEALSLDDVAGLLGISKASASMGTRQLLAWRAIRQVWVVGQRRDHFQLEPDLSRRFKSGYLDFVKPRLETTEKRLERSLALLEEDFSDGKTPLEEYELCLARLRDLQKFQKRLCALFPLVEKLF